MKWHVFPRSPEWLDRDRGLIRKRTDGYESEVDALIRRMLGNDDIRRDQQIAWERWWLNTDSLEAARPLVPFWNAPAPERKERGAPAGNPGATDVRGSP